VRYTPKAMGSHTGVVPVHVLPVGGTAVVQVSLTGHNCRMLLTYRHALHTMMPADVLFRLVIPK
jgi:hypothetical protein